MLKRSKILIVALLALVSVSSLAADDRVKRAQFTTHVVQREPVDNVSKMETSYKTLTFFTEIVNCKGCTISHQWWFKGEMKHEQKGTPKYNRYRWWSRKTVNPNDPGTWTVKVTINGRVVHTSSVNYFVQSKREQHKAPIQKRMQRDEAHKCEQKLKYFHEKSKENPDDPYFKFMLNKWGKRCYDVE